MVADRQIEHFAWADDALKNMVGVCLQAAFYAGLQRGIGRKDSIGRFDGHRVNIGTHKGPAKGFVADDRIHAIGAYADVQTPYTGPGWDFPAMVSSQHI